MTKSTSALFVRNPIQYEFVPAKYPVEPSMLNFKPVADGIEALDTELVSPSRVGIEAARHARLRMTVLRIHIVFAAEGKDIS